MALNSLWKVQDLETNTEELWESLGFLKKFTNKKGVYNSEKSFNERFRLNEESDEPLEGLIFRGRYRVSIVYVLGEKSKRPRLPKDRDTRYGE